MRNRVCGIIIKNKRVLLIHRYKNQNEYYTVIGGGVERKESLDDSLMREVKEESSLKILDYRYLGKEKVNTQINYYFLVTNFSGIPKLGDGPESKDMSESNKYILEWVSVSSLNNINIAPPGALKFILNSNG